MISLGQAVDEVVAVRLGAEILERHHRDHRRGGVDVAPRPDASRAVATGVGARPRRRQSSHRGECQRGRCGVRRTTTRGARSDDASAARRAHPRCAYRRSGSGSMARSMTRREPRRHIRTRARDRSARSPAACARRRSCEVARLQRGTRRSAGDRAARRCCRCRSRGLAAPPASTSGAR